MKIERLFTIVYKYILNIPNIYIYTYNNHMGYGVKYRIYRNKSYSTKRFCLISPSNFYKAKCKAFHLFQTVHNESPQIWAAEAIMGWSVITGVNYDNIMTALKNTERSEMKKDRWLSSHPRNKGLALLGLYFVDIMSVVVRSLYSKQESSQTKHVRHPNTADSVLIWIFNNKQKYVIWSITFNFLGRYFRKLHVPQCRWFWWSCWLGLNVLGLVN